MSDGANSKDEGGPAVPEARLTYRVTDAATRATTDESVGSEGIFKNGKTYAPGATLELTAKTAQPFIDLGVLELVSEGGNDNA